VRGHTDCHTAPRRSGGAGSGGRRRSGREVLELRLRRRQSAVEGLGRARLGRRGSGGFGIRGLNWAWARAMARARVRVWGRVC